jgi:hypothetical protein
METPHCPKCGKNLSDHPPACPACGHALNGTAGVDEESATQAGSQEAPPSRLSPEVMEWARQQFREEEFLAGLRDVRENGGLELKDFIQELVSWSGHESAGSTRRSSVL